MTRPAFGRRARIVIAGAAVATALIVGVALLAGTRFFNRMIDGRTIAMMAAVANRAPHGVMLEKAPFATTAELERLTRPGGGDLKVTTDPLLHFRLNEPGVVEERISFSSAVRLDHPESNIARAYVYRHGPLGARPVVLWVPGQYVSDLASVPIAWFTRPIVRRGVDVVLLVPPYHLERSPAGVPSGDAVFATSLSDHLNVLAQGISDARRLLSWLRAQGVRTVGGFGGSLGALVLLRTATWDKLDFLTVFIPMVRIASLFDQPEAAPFRHRIAAETRTPSVILDAYAALDPGSDRPLVAPDRIAVLYGRYDHVASEAQMLSWAKAWGVKRLFGYNRGHALSLFTPAMYGDYALILDQDLRALGR